MTTFSTGGGADTPVVNGHVQLFITPNHRDSAVVLLTEADALAFAKDLTAAADKLADETAIAAQREREQTLRANKDALNLAYGTTPHKFFGGATGRGGDWPGTAPIAEWLAAAGYKVVPA